MDLYYDLAWNGSKQTLISEAEGRNVPMSGSDWSHSTIKPWAVASGSKANGQVKLPPWAAASSIILRFSCEHWAANAPLDKRLGGTVGNNLSASTILKPILLLQLNLFSFS